MADLESQHRMDVADEQAANGRYMEILQRKADLKIGIGVSRNSQWTGSGPPPPTGPVVGPFAARVALSEPDALIGVPTFYIGPWYVDEAGLVVYSWASKIGSVLYGDGQDHGFGTVVGQRTMHLRGQAVADFTEDWHGDPPSTSPFRPTDGPKVPKPPSDVRVLDPRPPSPVGTGEPAALPRSESEAPQDPGPPASHSAPPKKLVKSALRPLRAEVAVMQALAAPRGASLPTLLATLQPDQYDFVTRSPHPPLIIQGHPGTGKTVIAAHRAAWLVHPERGEVAASTRVLIVGPNQSYSDHVKGVLDSLVIDRSRVVAMGLPQLLQRLRRIDVEMRGSLDLKYYDVANDTGHVIEAAAHQLRVSGSLHSQMSVDQSAQLVYDAVRKNTVDDLLLSDDAHLIEWLRSLPRWKAALADRRFLSLTTACSISAQAPGVQGFDHVVVDEAQDVLPLDWLALQRLNKGGTWTILGDLNQRRSDWSYSSWSQLANDLGLSEPSEEFSPQVFSRGYRSTAPIMRFANRLLPASERSTDQVQLDGPPPRVFRAKEAMLASDSIAIALHLSSTYRDGNVAVITVDRPMIGTELLRRGWRQDAKSVLRFGNQRVHLLTPESARGLEFDAVVVVEPMDFPTNVGRLGPLYTSLTRANRELAVIHSKGLPDGLKNQGLKALITELVTSTEDDEPARR